jgi:hypothetical protein
MLKSRKILKNRKKISSIPVFETLKTNAIKTWNNALGQALFRVKCFDQFFFMSQFYQRSARNKVFTKFAFYDCKTTIVANYIIFTNTCVHNLLVFV